MSTDAELIAALRAEMVYDGCQSGSVERFHGCIRLSEGAE